MTSDDLREKGLAMRTRLFGEDYERRMDRSVYRDDPVMANHEEYGFSGVLPTR